MTSEKPASLHVEDCACQGRGEGSSDGSGMSWGDPIHIGERSRVPRRGTNHVYGGMASGRGTTLKIYEEIDLYTLPSVIERLKA